MRPVVMLALAMLAAALGGCAGTTGQRSALAAKPPAAPSKTDLDSLAYGRAGASPAAKAPAQAAASAPQHAHAMGPAPVAMPVLVPTGVAFEGEPPYTLDTGDRLRVVVFGQDGLTNSYTVDASGCITMPLIKSVTARGLTTQALARVVAEKLRSGFVREPHVAIEVDVYRPFFILGEVTTPGQYAYVPHMTVENAVAIAGGFTPRAYRWDIRIDRPHAGGVVRQSVPLLTKIRPGDTVIVKERWF